MIKRLDVKQALAAIHLGQVLAYPTEAVYGLGCDPFQQDAVERILLMKGRSAAKGMIILIADWPQLFALIDDLPMSAFDMLEDTWPGPTTWIFPKSALVPQWVCGEHNSIAIRMTAHPVARQLCRLGPLVSTSANHQGQEPARSLSELDHLFADNLDGVVMGDLGSAQQPSAIYDVLTGKRLR